MMKDDKTVSTQLSELNEKFDVLMELMKTLIRQKKGNKMQRLMDEVIKKGRIDTTAVMDLHGVSRTWAITLLRKAGAEYGFRFIKGDKQQKRPSVLIYSQSKVIKDQHNKITEILNLKRTVSFSELMTLFCKDLDEVRIIAEDYVQDNKGVTIEDGNKITRKTIN